MSTFAERLKTLEEATDSMSKSMNALREECNKLSLAYSGVNAKLDEVQVTTKKVERFLNQLEGAGFLTKLLWIVFTTSGIVAFIKSIISK